MARASLVVVIVAVGACARDPQQLQVQASLTSDPAQLPSAPRHDGPLPPASAAPVVHLSAGPAHVCALHADGVVSCWGSNRAGQIADHRTARATNQSTFAAVIAAPVGAPLRDALEVASGSDRTCVRRADGVWCWGAPVGPPEHIAGTEHAVEITRDCMRDAAGHVACWSDLLVADHEPELDGAIDLTTAGRNTCGVSHSGEIACRGPVADGAQREFARKASRTVPGAVELAIGDPQQICARVETGAVLCWSTEIYYSSGEVPDDPTPVPGIEHAISIAASRSFACAAERDRSVKCWGWPPDATDRVRTATRVPGVTADELVAGDAFVCARAGGDVACWGANGIGQLGTGWSMIRATPTQVPGIDDAIEVFTGSEYSCARRRGGEVSCWGRLGYDGTSGPQPRDVAAARGAVELAGFGQLCARFDTGEVRCGTERRLRVKARDAVDVSQSYTHSVVVRRDGTLMSWGEDYFGQFGTGEAQGVERARGVAKGVHDAIAAAAGDHATCFIRADHTTWCMGRTLSAITSRQELAPVEVGGADHAVAIQLGEYVGCVLRDDATVRCWGSGQSGRLGRRGPDDSRVAVPIEGLTDVVKLAGRRGAICGLRRDHSLACWGQNWYGELGDPAAIDWTDRPITVLTDVVDVSAASQVCAVRGSGAVFCWGLASTGQVGTQASASSATPLPVAFPRELR